MNIYSSSDLSTWKNEKTKNIIFSLIKDHIFTQKQFSFHIRNPINFTIKSLQINMSTITKKKKVLKFHT